jgi:hypothetical protein
MNNSGIKINKLLLIATRNSYQDVYQRPFSVRGTHNDLSRLEAYFDTRGAMRNTPINNWDFSNTMPDIIGISSSPVGMATIPNGWGTQRLRFLLEVESAFGGQGGSIMVSYIQGFSEYHDPSISGFVDPNMMFYINSITNVVRTMDAFGYWHVTPHSTFNVVTDLAGGNRYEEVESIGDLKLIRPKDVIETIGTLELHGDNNTNVVNTTGSISGKSNTSDRMNNDPMTYFTKTLNSFLEARSNAGRIEDTAGICETAGYALSEQSLMHMPFIYSLYALTGVFTPTSFTLATLKILDPGLSTHTTMFDNVNDIGLQNFSTILDTEHTAPMMQPTIETMISTTVSQTMTSIMSECLLSVMSLSMSNTSGQPIVIVTDAKSFIEDIDIQAYVNKAVSRIKNILLPEITKGNMLQVEVHILANVLGDTSIAVSVNYNPLTPFRFPTFADSLYVPVITDNLNKNGIINDFANIIEATYNQSTTPHY